MGEVPEITSLGFTYALLEAEPNSIAKILCSTSLLTVIHAGLHYQGFGDSAVSLSDYIPAYAILKLHNK